MNSNNIIDINEYKERKLRQKEELSNKKNYTQKTDEDERKNTFNLFMRVLATMRKESY